MLKGARGRERWKWTERKVGAVKRELAGRWGDLRSRPAHCPTLCVTLCSFLSQTHLQPACSLAGAMGPELPQMHAISQDQGRAVIHPTSEHQLGARHWEAKLKQVCWNSCRSPNSHGYSCLYTFAHVLSPRVTLLILSNWKNDWAFKCLARNHLFVKGS